jgi:hypothetical protein
MRIRRTFLSLALLVPFSGCSAQTYNAGGPDFNSDPPKTILVRVVGVDDATRPETVSIDGELLCHNYDPGRRRLPRCPAFNPEADGSKFEIEAYVDIGEHRVKVHGPGDGYVLKVDQLCMPGSIVTCTFDYNTMNCEGAADNDALAELEAMGDAPTPPDLDAPPTEDDAEPEDAPAEDAPAEDAPTEEAPAEEAAPE